MQVKKRYSMALPLALVLRIAPKLRKVTPYIKKGVKKGLDKLDDIKGPLKDFLEDPWRSHPSREVRIKAIENLGKLVKAAKSRAKLIKAKGQGIRGKSIDKIDSLLDKTYNKLEKLYKNKKFQKFLSKGDKRKPTKFVYVDKKGRTVGTKIDKNYVKPGARRWALDKMIEFSILAEKHIVPLTAAGIIAKDIKLNEDRIHKDLLQHKLNKEELESLENVMDKVWDKMWSYPAGSIQRKNIEIHLNKLNAEMNILKKDIRTVENRRREELALFFARPARKIKAWKALTSESE